MVALRVFESVAAGTHTPESDVDVLLEFEPGFELDLFEPGGVQHNLMDPFGLGVDLKTADMFSPRNLERVVASSLLVFSANARVGSRPPEA